MGLWEIYHYTPYSVTSFPGFIAFEWERGYLYSTCMNPENTQKLMGFYMEGLILGIILECMFYACFL